VIADALAAVRARRGWMSVGFHAEYKGYTPSMAATCDPTNYKGGSGQNDNPCDEWPPAPKAQYPPGCPCPPDWGDYQGRKWGMSILGCIPFIGSGITAVWGLPKTCDEPYKDAIIKYKSAQAEAVATIAQIRHTWDEILQDFKEIYDPVTHTGILPTSLGLMVTPALHTAVYIGICLFGLFLVLLGVLFTI